MRYLRRMRGGSAVLSGILVAACGLAVAAIAPAQPAARDVIGSSGGFAYAGEEFGVTPSSTGKAIVKCPRGTAVTGGGTFADSGSAWWSSMMTSAPVPTENRRRQPTRWESGSSGSIHPAQAHNIFSYAICAKKTRGLRYVTRRDENEDPGGITVKAPCPKGTVVVGGGAYVKGQRGIGNLMASSPYPISGAKPKRGWFARGEIDGGTTLLATAVCSKPKGVEYRKESIGIPPGDFDGAFSSAACPLGSVVSGGGAAITGSDNSDKGILNSSSPQPAGTDSIPRRGWIAEAYTSSGESLTLHNFAICRK